MQMYHIAAITTYFVQNRLAISLTAKFFFYGYSKLCAAMLGVKIGQVDCTDRLSFFVVNHQPHLSVGINIALGRSDVVDQHAARIRHIGGTHAPYRTVVLQRLERVKVFGLHGSQTDWRERFHSFGG